MYMIQFSFSSDQRARCIFALPLHFVYLRYRTHNVVSVGKITLLSV